MIGLTSEQRAAADHKGNAIVTACPGSGKTRVLTARVIRGLAEISTPKARVIAMTFTNRATDEIQSRLDALGVERDNLWAGTIHSFALEWILRPYAPYVGRLRHGFKVADEYYSQRLLGEFRTQFGRPAYFEVNTARNREGDVINDHPDAEAIFRLYQDRLTEFHLVDYDDILHLAYSLLDSNEEIAATIGNIVELFCIDEIQDTQDLQFGILSRIFSAADRAPCLFFVGDADQCIYESLGATARSPEEIAQEFGVDSIDHVELTGNFRSTQRIVDFYQHLRPHTHRIESLVDYAAEHGSLTFCDQTIAKEDLPEAVAGMIRDALDSGVPAGDICVMGPQWWHIRHLGRLLIGQLPDVDFDAPGLSPFHSQRENIWFKISRLVLTAPRPNLYRTRLRWAREVLRELADTYGIAVPGVAETPRRLLRLMNATTSHHGDGLEYLMDVFRKLMAALGVELGSVESLRSAHELFFEKAESRLVEIGQDAPRDAASFAKLFRHPSGVVISTCHGVKGEEYDTVIAFGLLRGYIPNWQVIIHAPEIADERASKLLYVICSRAKRRLHLIAESGRQTQSGNDYATTPLLQAIGFEYG